MKKLSLYILIWCMPMMLFAGWDDIENDVTMMKENTPTLGDTQEAAQSKQQSIAIPPTNTVPSSYQPLEIFDEDEDEDEDEEEEEEEEVKKTQEKPIFGLGILTSIGSGRWNFTSNEIQHTAEFDLRSNGFGFFNKYSDGIVDARVIWGDIIYSDGTSTTFSAGEVKGRFGISNNKENTFSPYATLGLTYLWVDTGNDYTYNEYDLGFGVGIALNIDVFQIYVEYSYHLPFSLEDIPVSHRYGKFNFGTAYYFE